MSMSPLYSCFVSFVSAFLFSAFLTPVVRKMAMARHFVARPREDRWHNRPTALLGGVSIFLSTMAVLMPAALLFEYPVPIESIAPFGLLGAAMFVLGLVDDLFELSPLHKLAGQVIIASLAVACGFRFNGFESVPINMAISVLWLVGITNAFNLIDNMDGLSAGIAVISAVSLFVLQRSFFTVGEWVYPSLFVLAAFIGSLAGFLIYNFHPASIFMGDSGSLFIGFVLAMLTVHGTGTGSTIYSMDRIIPLLIPVLVLFVPLVDMIFVILMRKLSRRAVFQGGRDHSSHRLVALGFSEKKAVLILYAFAVLSGSVAVLVQTTSIGRSAPLIFIFFLSAVFLWIRLAKVTNRGIK